MFALHYEDFVGPLRNAIAEVHEATDGNNARQPVVFKQVTVSPKKLYRNCGQFILKSLFCVFFALQESKFNRFVSKLWALRWPNGWNLGMWLF